MFKRFSLVYRSITHLLFPCHVTDVYGPFVQFWQQDHRGRVCSLCVGTNWQVFWPMLKVLYITREFKLSICKKLHIQQSINWKGHYRFIRKSYILLFIFSKYFVYYWTNVLTMKTVVFITFIQTDKSFSFRVVKVSFRYIFRAQALGEITGSVV